MKSYRIVRHYWNGNKTKTIKTGLTLKQAQEHCNREDTHKKDVKGCIVWFDGYTNHF